MDTNRRDFVAAAGVTLASSVLARRVKGANDRIAVGFIGVGIMGQVDLALAMRHPGLQVAAVCDVYQPNLEKAVATAQKGGHQPKFFKEIGRASCRERV